MKKYSRLFQLTVIFMLFVPGQALSKEKASILYISNFSSQYYWNKAVKSQLAKAFNRRNIEVDFYEEILDMRRKNEKSRAAIFAALKQLYKEKYRETRLDLIISSDDSLLGKHGRSLFPDTPFLFCYTRDSSKDRLSEMGNASATIDKRDPRQIIDTALNLHPKTKTIAVVSDDSEVSAFYAQTIYTLARHYSETRFWYIYAQNRAQLVVALHKLPPQTVVIDVSYFSSPLTNNLIHHDNAIIYKETGLPVYSLWGNPVGYGVLAGQSLSTRAHGEQAAELAIRIIREGTAATTPPVTLENNAMEFDYGMMKLFSIGEETLPEGTIIKNRPPSFLRSYRNLLITAAVTTLFLMVIVTLLSIALSQKKREKRLLLMELHAEKKESTARLKLQQAHKMDALIKFSAGIAHDLNGVLGSILASISLINKEGLKGKHLVSDLKQIDYAAQRGVDLINKISFAETLSHKKRSLLHTAISESVAIIRTQVPEGIVLTVSNPESMTEIPLEKSDMHQILQNLCINAIQAMSVQGYLDIRVEELPAIKQVRIAVSDTGAGIHERDRENLFDPYFTTKKEKGGTGLGLFIVHSIISAASGTIDISTRIETGTCFRFTLPLLTSQGRSDV